MSYTADNIRQLSINTPKTWNGDNPTPGFVTELFNTSNWNCAATAIIRSWCNKLFDTYSNVDWASDPKSYLFGDQFSDSCWFDWNENQARFGVQINGFDVVGFRFQDHSFVFFLGPDNISYFVQWYKNRGRTEIIAVMDGDNMLTADPIKTEEYADLLNTLVAYPVKALPLKKQHNIEYAFWWVDELATGGRECDDE